jgi:hypothetical protein
MKQADEWRFLPLLSKLKGLIAFSPNVVVKWLAFVFHIPEVPDSNLGLETDYHD